MSKLRLREVRLLPKVQPLGRKSRPRPQVCATRSRALCTRVKGRAAGWEVESYPRPPALSRRDFLGSVTKEKMPYCQLNFRTLNNRVLDPVVLQTEHSVVVMSVPPPTGFLVTQTGVGSQASGHGAGVPVTARTRPGACSSGHRGQQAACSTGPPTFRGGGRGPAWPQGFMLQAWHLSCCNQPLSSAARGPLLPYTSSVSNLKGSRG